MTVSYFVRYEIEDSEAFVRHYKERHVPILARWPGIRRVVLHRPVPWTDPCPVNRGATVLVAAAPANPPASLLLPVGAAQLAAGVLLPGMANAMSEGLWLAPNPFDPRHGDVLAIGFDLPQADRVVVTVTDKHGRLSWRSAELALEAIEGKALARLRDTVAAAHAEYTSGSGDFLRLLESVMALQALEAQRIDAVARREVARVELERLVGPELGSKP